MFLKSPKYLNLRDVCCLICVWMSKQCHLEDSIFKYINILIHRYMCMYILGGGFTYFFRFIPIWGRFPFWLICFRWVEPTNQYSILAVCVTQIFLQVIFWTLVKSLAEKNEMLWMWWCLKSCLYSLANQHGNGKWTFRRCIPYWTWVFPLPC